MCVAAAWYANRKSSRLNTTGEGQCKDLRYEYEKGYLSFVFNKRRLVSISMRPHSAVLSQVEELPLLFHIWQICKICQAECSIYFKKILLLPQI